MHEEGYDVEVIQEISSDLYCVICLKLLRNPVQFKCGHGMCYNCYKHLLCQAKNKGIKDIQCPQCREIVRESQQHYTCNGNEAEIFSNVMLHRLILSLQIYCTNEREGCLWVGEVSQLEDHLTVCMENTRSKTFSELNSSPIRRNVSLPVLPDAAHTNMMVNMMDSLSSLRTKIDAIENNLIPLHSLPEKSGACTNCRSVSLKSEERKQSRRQTQGKFFGMKQYIFDIANDNHLIYMKICFLVALVSIYVMTAKLFYTFEKPQTVSSCGNQDIDSSLVYRLQKSVEANEHGVHHAQNLLAFNIKVRLHDLQSEEIRTSTLIPLYYKEQNRTIVELDKRFQWMIEHSRQQIWTNISFFDERSIRELSLDSVNVLANMANPIFNALWRKVFEEINFSEYSAIRNAGKTYETARQKYLEIQEKAYFYAQEIEKGFGLNIKIDEYNEMAKNMTQRLKTLNRKKIEGVVQQDYTHFRSHFERVLGSFYDNVTQSITHETRFKFLVDKVKDRNLKNGRFVWNVNMTSLQSKSKTVEILKSSTFQSGSGNTARLFLYHDRTKKGFLKLTFIQMEDRSVKIWLSLLSHIRPEYMVCFDDPIGGVLPGLKITKKKPKAVKFFSIPVSIMELKSKGFIHNNNIYVRCLTTD